MRGKRVYLLILILTVILLSGFVYAGIFDFITGKAIATKGHNCTDSDGAYNFLESGYVWYDGYNYYDFCVDLNGDNLTETAYDYYCPGAPVPVNAFPSAMAVAPITPSPPPKTARNCGFYGAGWFCSGGRCVEGNYTRVFLVYGDNAPTFLDVIELGNLAAWLNQNYGINSQILQVEDLSSSDLQDSLIAFVFDLRATVFYDYDAPSYGLLAQDIFNHWLNSNMLRSLCSNIIDLDSIASPTDLQGACGGWTPVHPRHKICSNSTCIFVEGDGMDQCTYYYECSNQTVECYTNDDCPANEICVNGECIQNNQTDTCTDSDGGLNYYVFGSVVGLESPNGSLINRSDFCGSMFGGNHLVERYCDGDLVSSEDYLCPYLCDQGVCVPNSELTYSIELLSASDTSATIKVSKVHPNMTSAIEEVEEGELEMINNLPVYVIYADETTGCLSARIGYNVILSDGGDAPSAGEFKFTNHAAGTGYDYQFILVSASDTSATIKVVRDGTSDMKEVLEGSAKIINGVNVYLRAADETNLALFADFDVSPFDMQVGECQNCTPQTCSQLGYECGTWSDGCGGNINCGSCASGEFCDINGQCISNQSGCEILNARWTEGDVYEGTIVPLIVQVTPECFGEMITFLVWEDDFIGDDPVVNNPSSVIITNTSQVVSSWTAEWQAEGFPETDPPEYYFVASLDSLGISLLSKDSEIPYQLLHVYESNLTCGNGNCDAGENWQNCPEDCGTQCWYTCIHEYFGSSAVCKPSCTPGSINIGSLGCPVRCCCYTNQTNPFLF